MPSTSYHFLFMPLSIGLSLLIAIMQTAWSYPDA
ncbi:MAG TPA: cytochrome ubiquinol oxidase subunit I [Streptosporangiaceae bacterium]|jgi:cytochrome bd-type quinol oxidase subunit 1|nr:cytochrome ubiquinol oxidase subunit I [Streptosporangiaceae bacterium]